MPLSGSMIYVKDLERMKSFYADLLGIQPTDSTEGWVSFDADGMLLALHAIPAEIAAGIEIAYPAVLREDAAVKLLFEMPDVEAARERLESLGTQTLRRPWQRAGEACDVVDPEGNIVQLRSARVKST
ncbi:VOC family protein [Occallatibacter riparius]|uniref:VOC family protein n=1 Tax=Occallatibacter riparius TaxID=1002689 RepID=A0A9J7BW88_9BACT|nr:VOC family protein [Occallatibacter riparius]UWZ86777.1 VOC family protein [Occallatibacter riparius]